MNTLQTDPIHTFNIHFALEHPIKNQQDKSKFNTCSIRMISVKTPSTRLYPFQQV